MRSSGFRRVTGIAAETQTASKNKKNKGKSVYINEKNVEVFPVRTRYSSRDTKRGSSTTITSSSTNNKLFRGGQYFRIIGRSLQTIGAGKFLMIWNQRLFLREAGQAIQDIGFAWQGGDWEAVSYAALDASQTMELVAQSLNDQRSTVYPTNKLQRAFAGIAVELKCLSQKENLPQHPNLDLNLQGLALRLHQASRSLVLEDRFTDITSRTKTRPLEDASQAAQSLAKLYGANSHFLPRRWRLWWMDHVATATVPVDIEEESDDDAKPLRP